MRRAAVLLALALATVLAGCGKSPRDKLSGYHVYRIPSSAMEPTLHCAKPGDGCLGERDDKVLVSPAQTLRRSDIVAFRAPDRAGSLCGAGGVYLKRVVGLPGEEVSYNGTRLVIDGKRIAEPYVSSSLSGGPTGAWKVPPGRYLLLGDARSQSCDSRVWGALPERNVIGVVTRIFHH